MNMGLRCLIFGHRVKDITFEAQHCVHCGAFFPAIRIPRPLPPDAPHPSVRLSEGQWDMIVDYLGGIDKEPAQILRSEIIRELVGK
jgi:hypothetical protein